MLVDFRDCGDVEVRHIADLIPHPLFQCPQRLLGCSKKILQSPVGLAATHIDLTRIGAKASTNSATSATFSACLANLAILSSPTMAATRCGRLHRTDRRPPRQRPVRVGLDSRSGRASPPVTESVSSNLVFFELYVLQRKFQPIHILFCQRGLCQKHVCRTAQQHKPHNTYAQKFP